VELPLPAAPLRRPFLTKGAHALFLIFG
jgi:hypothetical protein